MRRPALLAVLILPLLAVPARASTVSQVIRDGCFGDPVCQKYAQGQVPVTRFEGAPGETNSVTLTRDGQSFVFGDLASDLHAVTPCTQVDAKTARCPVTDGVGGLPGLEIDTGDGDDAVTITGDPEVESRISGGPGNDTVIGGDGNDTIDGGPGDDKLNGGGGANVLTYETRTQDVTVSLKAGSGGESAIGENDTLAGFRTLLSGSGVDVLIGSRHDDTIDGGPGADNINGGGGDDSLFGNTGPDALRGGRDDDRLFGDPASGPTLDGSPFRFSDDFLEGDSGDDELDDPGGRNTFLGGPGRDRIQGGKGRDRVRGGTGKDRIFARGGSKDRVDCGKGRDTAHTDKRDTRKSCEKR